MIDSGLIELLKGIYFHFKPIVWFENFLNLSLKLVFLGKVSTGFEIFFRLFGMPPAQEQLCKQLNALRAQLSTGKLLQIEEGTLS